MVTCDELGVPLNEAPQYYDLCTMAVDGVKVWGTAPEGAPDFEESNTPQTDDKDKKDPEGSVLYGDVNCDKKVDISDVILLSRFSANEPVNVSKQGTINADCNVDGVVSIDDAGLILQYIARIITKLGK